MLSVFQTDIDTYNEKTGQAIGGVVFIVLIIVVIVWLVKRSRKG